MRRHLVGSLVVNPNRPQWGPGKVVHINGTLIYVIFRDVPGRVAKAIRTDIVPLDASPIQHDAILDNLPPVQVVGARVLLPAARVTLQEARAKFLARFPGGFRDVDYIGKLNRKSERLYKVEAHRRFVEDLGGTQFRNLLAGDLQELTRRAMRCIGRVNLLYPVEQAAFRDALADEAASKEFFEALAFVLEDPGVNESSFRPYLEAVVRLPADKARVASWPVATILPFLAQPKRHLFIKPTITTEAAARLAFTLNYRAEPNWITYSSALKMADVYREQLAELEPEDLIDIQSFFYVTCGGYDI